ncbi:hypothetical protein CVT24_004676 [Panaeolus cyanescens]|uniref:F-box domain-containing protein n=1 Tax=Panaeolus cyanescens TaxID=181874 RepID=A0A409W1A4_9AGAR|nr:hypothetical protein CVT24_004676 [Panaeolus cyanescens]
MSISCQVPPEIWREILLRCLPPSDLIQLKSSLNPIWHAMVRQKKAIVLVCWQWYELGLPFLYEDICIMRPHQLALLHGTLKQSEPLRHHVKRLRISTIVPNRFMKTFQVIFQAVLNSCPSLAVLDLVKHCGLPDNTKILVTPCLRLPSNVTSLTIGARFGDRPQHGTIHHILASVCQTLIHLSVVDFKPLSQLTFPALTTLIFIGGCSSWPLTVSDLYLTDGYDYPALQDVTFLSPGRWYYPQASIARFTAFCDKYGSHLRTLQMNTPLVCASPPQLSPVASYVPNVWHDMINKCPLLEHIFLPACVVVSIRHPHIKWVDVWECARVDMQLPCTCLEIVAGHVIKDNFPSIQGVRVFASNLDRHYPRISTFLPPSLNVGSDFKPFNVEFPRLNVVRHEAGRVFCPLFESNWADDEDSDDTYEEDSGSDDDSSSDGSDISTDEISSGPDEYDDGDDMDEDGNWLGPMDCDLLLERYGTGTST